MLTSEKNTGTRFVVYPTRKTTNGFAALGSTAETNPPRTCLVTLINHLGPSGRRRLLFQNVLGGFPLILLSETTLITSAVQMEKRTNWMAAVSLILGSSFLVALLFFSGRRSMRLSHIGSFGELFPRPLLLELCSGT